MTFQVNITQLLAGTDFLNLKQSYLITMTSINVNEARYNGPTKLCERKLVKKMMRSSAVGAFGKVHIPRLDNAKGISSTNSLKICYWSSNHVNMFYWPMARHRKHMRRLINNNIRSDCSLDSYEVEEISESKEGPTLKDETFDLVGSAVKSNSENVKKEFIRLTLPAIGGHALEPLAQLMETAFIGRLGPVELASAGVSVSIFNLISKIFNMPLLSVATSFVAEDISRNSGTESVSDGGFQDGSSNGRPHTEISERKQLASVSTALFLASGIGIFEALALYLGSGLFLNMMGISSASSMRVPAQQFLSLRAIGAPAVVLSLALKGVFHGFKDTKTPSLCLGAGNLSAVFLFPLLMYSLRLGIIGAAIATVISQYIVTFLMIWYLSKRAILLPPKMENLRFDSYVKSGGFLLVRTLALLCTMTLGTSMAARQGPLAMAAHQICMQVWLAVSLLTDALAATGQALIASSFSKGDYSTVKEITYYLLKAGLLAGVLLAVSLGASFGSLATLFTKDADVLDIVRSLALFVCASQPLNALAFIADGAYYGVSDFAYAAQSMVVVGAISSAFFLYAPIFGLSGVWLGLVLCMALRTLAGYIRLMSRNGPWWFLHKDIQISEEGSQPSIT